MAFVNQGSESHFSFQRMPFDIMRHHIFKDLDLSSLVACSFVCSHLRNHAARPLSNVPKYKTQSSVLEDIFGNGLLNLYTWFRARLRFPSIAQLSERRPALLYQCLLRAAEGKHQ